MADRAHHCPFLNRADDRCSTSFNLDHLEKAYSHCFGSYASCPVYEEMLAERRLRRAGCTVSGNAANPGCSTHWVGEGQQLVTATREASHAQAPIIQLTLTGRYAQQPAGDSRVPVASGV